MDNNIPVYFISNERWLARGWTNETGKKVIEKKLDKIILINKVDIIDENGNISYDFPHWKQAPAEVEKICFSFDKLKEKRKEYFEEKIKIYKEECETLEGFLNFPLKHEISGEYVDYEAKEVYEEIIEKYLKEYKGE